MVFQCIPTQKQLVMDLDNLEPAEPKAGSEDVPLEHVALEEAGMTSRVCMDQP